MTTMKAWVRVLTAASLAASAGCSSSSTPAAGADGGEQPGEDGGHHGSGGGSSTHASNGSHGSQASQGSQASGSSTSVASTSESSGATIAGIPGGQVGVGTTISGCAIFPPDNAWNVAVDGPDVQVIHTYDSHLPQGTTIHPDFGGYTTDNGGIPFNTYPATQAEEEIEFEAYASESDPGPGGWTSANPVTSGASMGTTKWPFAVGMKIEGDPPKGGMAGNLPGDQHGIVLLEGASSCTSYEAWNCVVVSSPPFQCANGAVFDLSSNATRTLGWTSADAAGLSILAGLVRLEEVTVAKVVTHAVRVTFNATQAGYILPATHAASSNPLGSAYPPMGLRLRLKASVDTSTYTEASQVIMAGLKKYGLIVADNGSDWYFQGDSDDGWTKMAPDGQDTIIDEVVGDFRHLTGGDFEAVFSGDPIATGL